MDFWDLTKIILRRWYVAVPLMVLTLGASVWTYSYVSPDYQATAYVALIPPTQTGLTPEDSLRNPYLDLGLTSLNQAAATVTKDQAFLEELTDSGLSDAVAIEEGYPAPIATIEVIASSEALAVATVNRVIERYNQSVEMLQTDARAKPNSLITTQRLGAINIEETGGKVKRAMIGVFAAGTLIAAGSSIIFDSIVRRRQRRRMGGLDEMRAIPLPEVLPPTTRRAGSLPPVIAPAQIARQLPDLTPPPSARSTTVTANGGAEVTTSLTVSAGGPAPASGVADGPERRAERDARGTADQTLILPLAVPDGLGKNRKGGPRS